MSFSFWGTSIKAGESYEFTPPEQTLFHMSGAALDSPQDAAPASLIVKTEGNSVTLVNFDPQKLTNQQLDLVFPAGVQCEFSVRQNRSGSSAKKSKSSSGTSSCSISVSGYLQPSPFDYIEEPSSSNKRKRSRGIDGISSTPIASQKKAKLGDQHDDESNDIDEDYDIEDLDSDDEDDEIDEFGSEEMLDSDDGNGPNLDEVLNLGDISSSSGDDGDEEAKEPVVVATKKSKKKEKKVTKKDKKEKKAKKNSGVPTPDNPEQSVEKAAETVDFPLSKSQKKKLKKQQKKQQKAATASEAKNSEDSDEKSVKTSAAVDKKAKKKKDSDESDKKSAAAAAPEKKKDAAPVEQKKKPQVKEQNGVKYIDFQVGTGKSVKQGKRVKVLYVGTLAKNGKQFDKQMQYPLSFKLGKGEVIKGWDVGIQGMKVGGRRKLLIPSALAYGAKGAPPDIPPHADLRFTVQVVE